MAHTVRRRLQSDLHRYSRSSELEVAESITIDARPKAWEPWVPARAESRQSVGSAPVLFVSGDTEHRVRLRERDVLASIPLDLDDSVAISAFEGDSDLDAAFATDEGGGRAFAVP